MCQSFEVTRCVATLSLRDTGASQLGWHICWIRSMCSLVWLRAWRITALGGIAALSDNRPPISESLVHDQPKLGAMGASKHSRKESSLRSLGFRLAAQLASIALVIWTNLRHKGSEQAHVAAFGDMIGGRSWLAWSPFAHVWTSLTMCHAYPRRRIAPRSEHDGLPCNCRTPLNDNVSLMDKLVDIWIPDWELEVDLGAQRHASVD